ncbi:MAG: hypothetical protein ACK4HQ_01040, partial [Brevinematales bacterium]
MGRFDSIEKFLGKEENFSPKQIEAGLDTMDDIPSRLSDVNPDAMANVERLLQATEGSSVSQTGTPETAGTTEGPSLGMGSSVSLSEEILKELAALDGPPPSLEELETRFSSLRDIASTMEEETTEEQISQFEENVFEKEPSFSPPEEVKLSVPEGEIDSGLADLLGQMKAEPEVAPSSGGGLDDLLASLGMSESEKPGAEVSAPFASEIGTETGPLVEEAFVPEVLSGEAMTGEEPEMPSLEGFGEIETPEIETGKVEPYAFPSFDETSLEPSLPEIGLEGLGKPGESSFESGWGTEKPVPSLEGGEEWGEIEVPEVEPVA